MASACNYAEGGEKDPLYGKNAAPTSAGYCLLCFGGRSGNVLIIRFFSQTGSVCSK